MEGLISFWSYALAAAMFLALLIWRLGAGTRLDGHRLLLAAFALTACWAWLSAIDPNHVLVSFAETARNLVWVSLLYSLSATGDARQHGLRLVYGAVSAVFGLQLVADMLSQVVHSGPLLETETLLRITGAAGSLVLVHNLYGQAAPASRSTIRFAMLGLAMIWIYDLNLYTIIYLGAGTGSALVDWRGVAVALTAPLFALGAKQEDGWRIRLSRAATFQSLSLLAICGYFAVMTVLATALRGSGWDWSGSLLVGLLAFMTVASMVLLPSPSARSWAKVKLAKHLFEHRYDYRTEWLRFTETLGRAGTDAPPLGERVVKAFADIADAPGGLLLVTDAAGALSTSAAWNWPGRNPPAGELESGDFWREVESSGRILELDAYRGRWGHPKDLVIDVPAWIAADDTAWAGVPLIHNDRLFGLVLLAAPDYRRALDWEDFDLLRVAGRQAASYLAEDRAHAALADAQRFDEFNRRFAFILHDIKNLVSQLTLVARNAERHADNPAFRVDMVATLQDSADRMNALLARLSQTHAAPGEPFQPVDVAALVNRVVGARRAQHPIAAQATGQVLARAQLARLEQVLGHLIQNGIEASHRDAPIVVAAAANGATIAIDVIDQGCGMSPGFVRHQLFRPFASSKPLGFGIGAFEALQLVEAMGGSLDVFSREGEGTRFRISLPTADAMEAAA